MGNHASPGGTLHARINHVADVQTGNSAHHSGEIIHMEMDGCRRYVGIFQVGNILLCR